MTLKDVVTSGGIIFLILTIIQIAPIQINPWSKLARLIGHALNGEVMDKLNVYEANTRRYRILRFDDEIRHSQKHTKEHFDQIMEDITEYERYCTSNPNYKNNKAVLAIENIKATYMTCAQTNNFL